MEYKPLAYDVIAVAVAGYARDWAAYIGAVAGINHSLEYRAVAKDGSKLSEEVAKILFPCWKGLRYRP